MSDNPTAVQQATVWHMNEVVSLLREVRRSLPDSWTDLCTEIDEALPAATLALEAAAGLLAVPTPALTPEQTDVVEAATNQRAAGAQTGFLLACLETHAAVDRLAAANRQERTMSAPSIAEIIGWVRCGRCKKHWNLSDEWGSERPITDSPTVDDLLAWIYAQTESYPDMIPVWDLTEGDGTKRGDGWLVEDERWDEWVYGYTPVYSVFGPTLLAALEAAVLDIARPTPSEDA